MQTINVGCGCNKWGDIRVDITKYSQLYNMSTTVNILASIEYLPFKDNSFEIARCYHTLEHIDNPKRGLSELIRVAGKVDVIVPTHNFYCMIIYGVLSLPFVVIWSMRSQNINILFRHLRGIKNWGKRWTLHKWYIKPKGAKLVKWKYLPIPLEYRKIYG